MQAAETNKGCSFEGAIIQLTLISRLFAGLQYLPAKNELVQDQIYLTGSPGRA